jgi:proteasome accessory factor A
MAIPKVIGVETEYGISGGPGRDPILASSILVNTYAQQSRTSINWDFDAESPGMDARGFPSLTSLAPIVETHLANTVLPNGARFYVDHAHPEYSSPECRTPIEAVLYDLAGEEVLRRAVLSGNTTLTPDDQIVVYKNNSDGKGNSYGCHENYLLNRSLDFVDVVKAMVPHFVSRQIICGAGKVGAETDVGQATSPPFQLSQRSEFFEEIVGLETTLKRPIINTRDEPHGDAERFRRLHVIVGDANMSQVATFVKVGSTALLLAALEDWGASIFPASPRQPVRALHQFSLDTSLETTVMCDDGQQLSAWDFQDQLWELARRYANAKDTSSVGDEHEVEEILREWREMLDGVRDDRAGVADRVDWIAKQRLVEGYAERHNLGPTDARLRAIDLQYHDLRPEKSLSNRAGLRELWKKSEVLAAVFDPPTGTRAYFRGRCVSKYSDQIAAANWDSVVFDLGGDPLQRVPMMDPLRGTAALTQELLDRCPTAGELLAALDA